VGKGKLLRFSEMKTFNHVFQPGFNEIFNNNYHLKGNWAQSFFGNNNPVVLELGCGKGEYTTGLAEEYPQINYIGIDIKGARIWRGAKTSKEKGLRNVAFLRTSIDHIVSFFAPNEVAEIWLTFSDPQPKKPKKRLSSSVFLNRYIQFLKPGAIIHLKTDNRLLYEYSLALVKVNGLKINFASSDIYADNGLPTHVTQIQTFYEKQFLAGKKPIHYLEFVVGGSENIIEPEEFNKFESLKYREE
jgi:tRNA (guanine-N7-)-methyltransferase